MFNEDLDLIKKDKIGGRHLPGNVCSAQKCPDLIRHLVVGKGYQTLHEMVDIILKSLRKDHGRISCLSIDLKTEMEFFWLEKFPRAACSPMRNGP